MNTTTDKPGAGPTLTALGDKAVDPLPADAQTMLRATDVTVLSLIAFCVLLIFGFLAGLPLFWVIGGMALLWIAMLAYMRLNYAAEVEETSVLAKPEESAGDARFAVSISDALPQAVIVLDREGRVIHANAQAAELAEIGRAGRPLGVYLRDPGITSRISSALAGYTPEPLMIHRQTPTERYISLLFSAATQLGDGSGREIILVVLNDVTELVLSSQQRADFLANASHELKTPIASMLGYIETLRGHARDDPDAQQRFLGIMQSQAERMQRLIQDLLSLRRIEQIEHLAPTETADLDLAIRAAIESVAPLADMRGVKIKYKRNKRSIVPGHQDECVQLCLNLIENATKISPKGSTVKINLSHFDQWKPGVPFSGGKLKESAMTRTINPAPTSPLPLYTITISDRGPGFTREHLPRIGERFYRIAGDLSSKEKGTGLGLAIVKHIARRHRAGLYVRSEAGEGTEFCIIYRASDEDDANASAPILTKSDARQDF